MKQNHKFRFNATIGVRSFKTAFTCLLCALVYLLIDRNPTFACIGVIFGMGSAFGDSKLNGGNRLIGTVIGGFLGIIPVQALPVYPSRRAQLGDHAPLPLCGCTSAYSVQSDILLARRSSARRCCSLHNTVQYPR